MTPQARAIMSGAAVLLLAVAAGFWQYTAARSRPIVETQRIGAGAARPVQPAGPTARQALEQKAELSLTETQVRRLEELEREWHRMVGPLEAEAREAEAEFQRFMDAAVRSGRGSLPEIQHRAAEQGELLATYRTRREAHAGAVRQVLTDEQRARWSAMAASQRTGDRR